MLDERIAKLSDLIGRWADGRGEKKRQELNDRHPDGIVGTVGQIYMTRGKRKGRIWDNPRLPYFVPDSELKAEHPDIYEIVYHAILHPHTDFVLSLFPNQLGLIGKKVRITRFGCVRHTFHFYYSRTHPQRSILKSGKS